MLATLRRRRGGGMQLRQGTHAGALEQGIHQPVGQGLEAVADAGDCGGLQFRARDAGMGGQGADGAALLAQACIQLKGKHHVGEFALAIGAIAVVALAPAGVVPADLAEVLRSGGHRHHAGIGPVLQQRQQGLGQGHVPQVIHTELQFMPLGGGAARRCHHASVVDQQIKAAVALPDGGRRLLHAGQVRQIQVHQIHRSPIALLQQLLLGPLGFAGAAARQHHGGPAAFQGARGFQAQAAVGSSDQGDTALLVRDVSRGPTHRVT